MIESEYKQEIVIGEDVFTATKDMTYSFWTVSKGSYVYPGQYTTLPKAVLAAHEIVNKKKEKKVK